MAVGEKEERGNKGVKSLVFLEQPFSPDMFQ